MELTVVETRIKEQEVKCVLKCYGCVADGTIGGTQHDMGVLPRLQSWPFGLRGAREPLARTLHGVALQAPEPRTRTEQNRCSVQYRTEHNRPSALASHLLHLNTHLVARTMDAQSNAKRPASSVSSLPDAMLPQDGRVHSLCWLAVYPPACTHPDLDSRGRVLFCIPFFVILVASLPPFQ